MLSTYMSVCCCYTVYISALADLRGVGKEAMPPQDARGYEVTLSTKDFSVQFYTKCAV